MKNFVFSLTITADNWLEFYRTPRSTVVATTFDGRKIQFAAKHLLRHVGHNGVRGVFVLTIDDKNDFVSLDRQR